MEDTSLPSPQRIKISTNTFIGPNERCFIVAEIGQNHQGDWNIAKQMIKEAKEAGADCVKFQKTDIPSRFNKLALTRPYRGPHSWGDTYGEHKGYLEFSNEEFLDLKRYSDITNILFAATAMDNVSLEFLNSMDLPYIKIGSGDLHNRPLLIQAAKLNVPLMISTGMANLNEVTDAYNTLKAEHLNFCLLHCVSAYPAPFANVNLNNIKTYKKLYPDVNIGYSGHELGIDVSVAAVVLGAKVIERHFTLDKSWKGSDQLCSLTPSEFKDMVSAIRGFEHGSINEDDIFKKDSVKRALGSGEKTVQTSEMFCFQKLAKSVVASRNLDVNDEITWDNIQLKVAEPRGVLAKDAQTIIGKRIKRIVYEDDSIMFNDFLN